MSSLGISLWVVIVPFIVAFAAGVVQGPVVIPFLRRLKASQTERSYLESHVAKNGTPTMGGVMILLAFFLGTIIYAPSHPKVIPVLVLTIGFGLIGFIDDFLKVVLRRPDGLIAWQKMLLQIIVTTVFCVYLIYYTDVNLELMVPFSGGFSLDLGWVAVPILYFAVIGTVNGTNFTDGLDGLASSVTLIVALFFTVASILLGGELEPVSAAMMGALAAFLVFNHYPAKIFMGDTGSLALGGYVAGVAYLLQMPLFILIVGFIYLLEVVSVILQVGSFKITHGKKRIFRMAPIHHHFEKGGWSEIRIVITFTLITVVLCVLGILGLKGF
ncbi:Phospho-N-acetylmuramoyl-pentapeptide-transferase [Lachnospiraceae bacterium C10]|jgi:phospho-N-acetylmuramoyl-pentapeptide-transferase|nr:Phospho-N-acetylmuramoyl-pentapeptide-transferase [Lachnospiraceae bacterium C10]